MDSEKVASLATMSGIGGATIAGVGLTTIGIYATIGLVAGCAGYAAYKISKSAYKEFSAKKAENKLAMVANEVA
jgi:hypothetical protein